MGMEDFGVGDDEALGFWSLPDDEKASLIAQQQIILNDIEKKKRGNERHTRSQPTRRDNSVCSPISFSDTVEAQADTDFQEHDSERLISTTMRIIQPESDRKTRHKASCGVVSEQRQHMVTLLPYSQRGYQFFSGTPPSAKCIHQPSPASGTRLSVSTSPSTADEVSFSLSTISGNGDSKPSKYSKGSGSDDNDGHLSLLLPTLSDEFKPIIRKAKYRHTRSPDAPRRVLVPRRLETCEEETLEQKDNDDIFPVPGMPSIDRPLKQNPPLWIASESTNPDTCRYQTPPSRGHDNRGMDLPAHKIDRQSWKLKQWPELSAEAASEVDGFGPSFPFFPRENGDPSFLMERKEITKEYPEPTTSSGGQATANESEKTTRRISVANQDGAPGDTSEKKMFESKGGIVLLDETFEYHLEPDGLAVLMERKNNVDDFFDIYDLDEHCQCHTKSDGIKRLKLILKYPIPAESADPKGVLKGVSISPADGDGFEVTKDDEEDFDASVKETPSDGRNDERPAPDKLVASTTEKIQKSKNKKNYPCLYLGNEPSVLSVEDKYTANGLHFDDEEEERKEEDNTENTEIPSVCEEIASSIQRSKPIEDKSNGETVESTFFPLFKYHNVREEQLAGYYSGYEQTCAKVLKEEDSTVSEDISVHRPTGPTGDESTTRPRPKKPMRPRNIPPVLESVPKTAPTVSEQRLSILDPNEVDNALESRMKELELRVEERYKNMKAIDDTLTAMLQERESMMKEQEDAEVGEKDSIQQGAESKTSPRKSEKKGRESKTHETNFLQGIRRGESVRRAVSTSPEPHRQRSAASREGRELASSLPLSFMAGRSSSPKPGDVMVIQRKASAASIKREMARKGEKKPTGVKVFPPTKTSSRSVAAATKVVAQQQQQQKQQANTQAAPASREPVMTVSSNTSARPGDQYRWSSPERWAASIWSMIAMTPTEDKDDEEPLQCDPESDSVVKIFTPKGSLLSRTRSVSETRLLSRTNPKCLMSSSNSSQKASARKTWLAWRANAGKKEKFSTTSESKTSTLRRQIPMRCRSSTTNRLVLREDSTFSSDQSVLSSDEDYLFLDAPGELVVQLADFVDKYFYNTPEEEPVRARNQWRRF